MEKFCRLTNATHWDVVASLRLPSLPVACGAADPDLRLPLPSSPLTSDVAAAVADLLALCDVTYLDVKEDVVKTAGDGLEETSWLYKEVLRCDPEAFELSSAGLTTKPNLHKSLSNEKAFENDALTIPLHKDDPETILRGPAEKGFNFAASSGPRRPKSKKKEQDTFILSSDSQVSEHQDIVASFCELVDDLCAKVDIPGADQEGVAGSALPLPDIRRLVNEVSSLRPRKILHLIPMDLLSRLLTVLDQQILCGQGLSVDDNSDADASIMGALESTYVALAIMTHEDMPKQIYKEEIIERVLDFLRHQIMDIMCACDPSYRAIHKPGENGVHDVGADNEDDDVEASPVKRRSVRSVKVKKFTGGSNKVSSFVYTVIQKLCSNLVFLKELLSVVKLSDSCILQLLKITFSTFLAENIQLLQLKSIGLISVIYASYPQHQKFIIDETVQLIWKLPFAKRALRSYLLPDEDQKQIQMVTALLIQLVQCSANLPDIFKTKMPLNFFADTSTDANYLIKCHRAAADTSCQFWKNVVQRFAVAKPQDISEPKSVIENLVVDLLATLNMPEFPASSSILEVLVVLLLQNTGLKSKDLTARCSTIDLLGVIAARLKRDAANCREERFWITEEMSECKDDGGEGLTTDKCYICLEEEGLKHSIVCPACQRNFHLECLGITQGNQFRDSSCHICTSKKQLMVLQSYCESQMKNSAKKKSTGNASKSYASISKVEIVHQILLNYLQESSSDDDALLLASWFYFCQWYKDDPLFQENIAYYLARLKSRTILRDFKTTLTLSRKWAKKICLVLGQKSSFSRGFDRILNLFLASLRESSPVLRAKALRAVSSIVEADPEVLCDKHVQHAVEGRFSDTAISVREAALELVGRHIASHPDVSLKYFEKVADRIKDTGVSVRKRAIKIIRDMCISVPDFSHFTAASIEIISRIGDEESSVQDLVCKTFYEFWFEEPSSVQTQFVSDGSCVPIEVAKKTEQIVDLLRETPHHHHLIIVIKRNLALDFLPASAKATGVNAVSLASVRKRCELMCRRLLERILQIEEVNTSDDVKMLPYMLVLQAFCIVDPTLCMPATDPSQFVVTLQPYLKNQVENRLTARLLESIIFVIDDLLPLLEKPPQMILDELEQDLEHMIVRHSYLTVVHSCIRCLCSLSKITGKGATLIESLIQRSFKQLSVSTVDNKERLGRSLFCLGLLVRYGNDLILSSDNENGCVEKSVKLLKDYLLLDDFGLKSRSLQALGFILIARPEYMLEMDIRKILGASLCSGADARLKTQALQNLHEYLIDVENQMEKDANNVQNQYLPDVGNKVPVAAGAGDTNICGGIVQLYWDNILENSVDANDQVRQSALKIVEIVLRQGLVHPITCVPHLVALETDPLEVNSKMAHHLLINMNDKYPSFFESRLGDGLQMSFRFFQTIVSIHNTTSGNVKGKSSGSAFACVRPGISRIYRLIKANRASRNKFMHSIIKKFGAGGWSSSSIPFLLYSTEILASLPFTSSDEPLYLIYDINRIVQVRAGPVESNLKLWCASFSQGNPVEFKEPDGNYLAADEQFTSQNINLGIDTAASQIPYGISQENLERIQSDCHESIALQLLLKLKRHLKVVYGLNDARCQAFSLKEHPKPGETLSRQNIPFSIHDTPISLPSSYTTLVDNYQELKQLLRDDAVDYCAYTSSIKRKRPTPRMSRKKAGAARGDDDDDDNWTGGPQILNFGNQKISNGRVTRQRLQQNL